jgi:hypothetical protein
MLLNEFLKEHHKVQEQEATIRTAKIDPSPVPLDKSAVQSITPSQIYKWKGPEPNVPLTRTPTR